VEQVLDLGAYSGQIRVQVKGQRPQVLLQALVERIERLNRRSGYPARLRGPVAPPQRDGATMPLAIT